MTENHSHFMQHALRQAQQALEEGEFPVGCVVVYDQQIIATGRRIGTRLDTPSELEHAEIIALRQLESLGGSIDRGQITFYATLEPCLMCFGALLISGIGTIVYAYEDAMGGGTSCDRSRLPELYRENGIRIISGVNRQESLDLFKAYFSDPDIDYWRGSYLARYTLAH
ncbi:MAG: nucleoside deaminase [Desulfobacteraceae bacterium]